MAVRMTMIAAIMLMIPLQVPAADLVHDFTGRCQSCHLTIPQPGVKGFFTREIEALCTGCHGRQGGSHPVGVFAGMPIPDDFPLDWDGRITCSTCHDPHAARTEENPNLLRSPARGESFCRQCHQSTLGEAGRHPVIGMYAHSKAWTAPKGDSFLGGIDELSRICISCHDGASTGRLAAFETVDGTDRFRHGTNVSHPIGIDYARAAAGNRDLRSLEGLSARISLYEGKVGCASCHDLFSNLPMYLPIGNRQSALCLECHLK